jgi:multiple sugar transport system substrate-binding protein
MNITRRQTLLTAAAAAASVCFGRPTFAAAADEFAAAKIDWRQVSGKKINVLLSRHPWQEAIAPLISTFTQLTGIEVNLRTLPEQQFLTKVPADLTAGTFQFDVFMTQIAEAPQFAANNWVETIDNYMNDKKLTDPDWYQWSDFFPGAQQAATIGNTPFANLAITAEAQVLVYRTDILTKLNIVVPKTIEEVISAADLISQKTDIHGVTLRGGAALWWPLYGFVRSSGGDYFGPDKAAALTTPEAIAGADAYVRLAKDAPQGITNYDWDEINTAMLSGQAAMFLDSSVVYPRLKDPNLSTISDKIGVAPFPAGPAGVHPNSHYWTISMAKKAVEKEASWLFMAWATSKPIQAALALKGVLGPRASAWESQELLTALGSQFIDAVRTSLSSAALTPARLGFTEFADALRSNMQLALSGSKSAKQAMVDAQASWAAVQK